MCFTTTLVLNKFCITLKTKACGAACLYIGYGCFHYDNLSSAFLYRQVQDRFKPSPLCQSRNVVKTLEKKVILQNALFFAIFRFYSVQNPAFIAQIFTFCLILSPHIQ